MTNYIQNLNLVSVLDELRKAYELCKDEGHSELQNLLLRIRRTLLQVLHESLDLYGENAELHQQLSEAQAQLRRLRESGAHLAATAESPPLGTRKLS